MGAVIGFVVALLVSVYIARRLKEAGVTRSGAEGKVAGVCAGIALKYGYDLLAVRVLWILGTCALGGFGIVLYVVLGAMLPKR